MENENFEYLSKFEKLLFSVRLSIRYHTRRRMFFDRMNKFFSFLTVLSGTAVLASVLV